MHSVRRGKDSILQNDVVRERTEMSVNSGHKQRLGIYCFYDKYGHAASFIKTFLDDLMDNLDDLVVVVNGQLSDQARQLFSEYTKTIIVRENKDLTSLRTSRPFSHSVGKNLSHMMKSFA